MIKLDNYRILEKIYSSDKTEVYRAKTNSKLVIVKVLRNEYPSKFELNAFKQEYRMLEGLESKGVVKFLCIEKYKNNFAIIFEDIGATALSIFLNDKINFSLLESLSIAIKVANALEEIHGFNIIHRDIKPHNIVLNQNTGQLNIIDFGTATKIHKQNSTVSINSSLEGTLAYISPEQTGRMNKAVDYRTDFYSLGITLYQLFTGELPFPTVDRMELLHYHIAKKPIPPFQRNNTPKHISDIILKLLEKNPDDRYQSTKGLVYDLEWCIKNINKLEDTEFTIGSKDIDGKFQIREKLYGRTKEILRLVKSFNRVKTGANELVVVSGGLGVGKSVLVAELKNSLLTIENGYFCSGNCDSINKSLPFKAIAQSINDLIQQILTEDSDYISSIKNNLLNEFDGNGHLLMDIIPDLSKLIGEQPVLKDSVFAESQSTIHNDFEKFIRVICKKEKPVILFLDDFQWIDSASLNLLKFIVTNTDIKHLLIIVALRRSEDYYQDKNSIEFNKWLKDIKSFKEIFLEPISKFELTQLVVDTLGATEIQSKDLIDILYEKTAGNPFFVKEVFLNLYEQGHIYFFNNGWNWDIEAIQNVIRISENVVHLLIEKIKTLPKAYIEKMKLAACIGNWFNISVFANILQLGIAEVMSDLQRMANEGFITIRGNSVGFVQDEIREAIYEMMSLQEKSSYHYKIGFYYYRNATVQDLEIQIYTIIDHLNRGIEDLKTLDEKNIVMNLNLTMGNKSLLISDYHSACGFFRIVVQLLPPNAWENDYEKTLEIFLSLASTEFLAANYLEADKVYEILYKNCRTLLEKIPIVKSQIRQKILEGKGSDAIDLGFKTLNEMGLSLPDHLNDKELNEFFFREFAKYDDFLEERSIQDFLHFPKADDRTKIEIISLIATLSDIAMVFRPDLLGMISIIGVNISLQYGNTADSSISFMMWGVVTNLLYKDYESGYDLGILSLRLNKEIFPDEANLSKAYVLFSWNINPWINPIKEILNSKFIEKDFSLDNIDFVNKTFLKLLSCKLSIFLGNALEDVVVLINSCQALLAKHKIIIGQSIISPSLMFCLALQGKTESLISFNSTNFNEEEYLHENELIGQGIAYFYLRKLQLLYISGDFQNCLEVVSRLEAYLPFLSQHISFCEYYFISALLYIEIRETLSSQTREAWYEKFSDSYSYFKKWTELCEDNFKNKYLILKASKAQLENRILDAMNLYDEAIQISIQKDFISDAAIASELAAKFFDSIQKPKISKVYLVDALYYYTKWGAVSKVNQLIEKYPDLNKIKNQDIKKDFLNHSITISNVSITTDNKFLDIDTFIKASKVISTEIQLKKLLDGLMKILIENAGAERGFFILKENENWFIEVEGDLNSTRVLEALPLEGYDALSTKIVNYVIRVKEIIILNDAMNSGMFMNDTYIKKNQTKSILCLPILNKGNIIGVVYLENNLTTDAFTPERIQTLKLLSSQIAVSIENSFLYANLESEVEERTNKLSQVLNDVNALLAQVIDLKERQDADYFLTSLLIEPFNKNNAQSDVFQIDFFQKQKKEFYFKNKRYEIGGDINISEVIVLSGRKFLVLLNADAMGKSIQGAGGIIVLGTLFKSIIQRTNSQQNEKQYPELWLQKTFIEMQNTFLGFDGSMLISLIIGLLDERSGTFYYINADQPGITSYKSKASFAGYKIKKRKIYRVTKN